MESSEIKMFLGNEFQCLVVETAEPTANFGAGVLYDTLRDRSYYDLTRMIVSSVHSFKHR